MTDCHEYIVGGSGPTAMMAVHTLLEHGSEVLVIDAGQEPEHPVTVPDGDFLSLRRNDEGQYRYFAGTDPDALCGSGTVGGAQLTPPRTHTTALTDQWCPCESKDFNPVESLAKGGLGVAWGLGCCVFSKQELKQAALPVHAMNASYQWVADRIGISASVDDVRQHTVDGLKNIQKSLPADKVATRLLANYRCQKGRLSRLGFTMGRPALALLSEDKNNRTAASCNDMQFYADNGASAYRPWQDLESVLMKGKIKYLNNLYILKYCDIDGIISIDCLDINTKEKHHFRCKHLILACGALGSARIVARSEASSDPMPVLCNPYHYMVGIQTKLLGDAADDPRTSYAQLSAFLDPEKTNGRISMASVYSYRSMMLFRALKELPLPLPDARRIMRYVLPATSIVGIHHPQEQASWRRIQLTPDANSPSGDRLKADYTLSAREKQEMRYRNNLFRHAFSRLGCRMIRSITLPAGASIHYAGTLPINGHNTRYMLKTDGRLCLHPNVSVADASGFSFLPAKGITFSAMAWAHHVALQSLRPANG